MDFRGVVFGFCEKTGPVRDVRIWSKMGGNKWIHFKKVGSVENYWKSLEEGGISSNSLKVGNPKVTKKDVKIVN